MLTEDENGMLRASTDLWGGGRNQDFMNRSASNAKANAKTTQLRQAGYTVAGSGAGLSEGQLERDIDTYSFGGSGHHSTEETGRTLVGQDVRMVLCLAWTGQSTNPVAAFGSGDDPRTAGNTPPMLVFSGEFRGGTIGGLDVLGGGAAKGAFVFFVHKNSNKAVGKFATYVFKVFGKIFKVGKADAGSVTKLTGLPTRVHSQRRKLIKKHGEKNVSVSVSQLGKTTTGNAKGVESSILKKIYKRLGFVPKGNKRSFSQKNNIMKFYISAVIHPIPFSFIDPSEIRAELGKELRKVIKAIQKNT